VTTADKIFLWVIFGGFAYMVIAAVYLSAVDGIGWFDPRRKR